MRPASATTDRVRQDWSQGGNPCGDRVSSDLERVRRSTASNLRSVGHDATAKLHPWAKEPLAGVIGGSYCGYGALLKLRMQWS